MKDDLKAYIDKDINFKLKDFNTTQEKYKDYKPQEFNQFLKDSSEEIDNFFLWLEDNIEGGLTSVFYEGLKFDNKKNIRGMITYINDTTKNQIISDFIKGELDNPNNNTIKNFSILFYLKYYNRINESMKEVLKVKVGYFS